MIIFIEVNWKDPEVNGFVSLVIIYTFVAYVKITWSAEVIPLCFSGTRVQLLPKNYSDVNRVFETFS